MPVETVARARDVRRCEEIARADRARIDEPTTREALMSLPRVSCAPHQRYEQLVAAALNLSWITDELAIGGSFTDEHVIELVREHRVGAVIDLRDEACDDEALLCRHGIAFLSLPTIDHGAIAPRKLRDGVAFVVHHLTAGRRVLVHCEHGIGRSALLGLCVLVERGLPPLEALALTKDRRALVSPNPAQYEAWVTWLRAAGITPPSFDEFAMIAYRHVGGR